MTKRVYPYNSNVEMSNDEDWESFVGSEYEMTMYYHDMNDPKFELNFKIYDKINSLESITEQLQKCLNRLSIINFEIYVENADDDPFGIIRLFSEK